MGKLSHVKKKNNKNNQNLLCSRCEVSVVQGRRDTASFFLKISFSLSKCMWSVWHCAAATKPWAFNHTIFTYIIRFQLHSVAEDKSVEVGMLEDLIEGSFILNFK